MKNITIIGGGISGLSASCYLAKHEYNVILIDKNNSMGGRLNSFEDSGFIFDMGPSWYWMPDVFEKFFNDFGKSVSDYYTLTRLDPCYKYFISDSEIEIPMDINKLYETFEKIESGSSVYLKKYLAQAKRKYEISMNNFIELPNNSFKEYISYDLLKYFLKLDILKSLRNHISSFFKSKTLRELLEFPSMFLGGSPNNTPALYSLMNYADINGGTWYPMGGMREVSKAFLKLSKELGVRHILNEEIVSFKIYNGKIDAAVSKNRKSYKSDYYICCAEYPFVQMNLISKEYQTYKPSYWSKCNVAPSALIFYLGLSDKVLNLEHHNLFFDKNFDEHLDDIFKKNIWPKEPLFYVCCPSKTDSSIIPNSNSENIFILMPIASASEDSDLIREEYFNKIIYRLKDITGQSIEDKIVIKKSFCVNNFIKKYNAYKGNAYGLANTLFQTAFFKPKVRDKKINNLYYSGHFTVPGPGLPPAVISGKIVSDQIIKEG